MTMMNVFSTTHIEFLSYILWGFITTINTKRNHEYILWGS